MCKGASAALPTASPLTVLEHHEGYAYAQRGTLHDTAVFALARWPLEMRFKNGLVALAAL